MKTIVDRHCQLLIDELALQQLSGPPAGGVVSLFSNRMSLLAAEIFSFTSLAHQNSGAPAGTSGTHNYEPAADAAGIFQIYIVMFIYA